MLKTDILNNIQNIRNKIIDPLITKGLYTLYKELAEIPDNEINKCINDLLSSGKNLNPKNLLTLYKSQFIMRGYKVQLFPTEEQKSLLLQHVNAYRFIYNFLYAERKKLCDPYYKIKFVEVNKQKKELFMKQLNVTQLNFKQISLFWFKKKSILIKIDWADHPKFDNLYNKYKVAKDNGLIPNWVKDCSSYVINGCCKSFPPTPSGFRSKHNSASEFNIQQGDMVSFKDGKIVLPKIGGIRHNRNNYIPVDGKICTVGISFENGEWYAGISMKFNKKKPEKRTTGKIIGLDVGCRKLATIHDGTKTVIYGKKKDLSEKYQRAEKSLKRWQRRASARFLKGAEKQSLRYEFAQNKVRRLHKKLFNFRKDNIHQVTHRVLSKKIKQINIESLNVKGMMSNAGKEKVIGKHQLHKSLAEASMSSFLQTIKYKSEWRGITVKEAKKSYASSKTCSGCNTKNDIGSKEIWICSKCNIRHDRDENAAKNLYNLKDFVS